MAIEFKPVRTARLNVQLQELTLGSAGAVCQVPAEQNERTTTVLLKKAIASAVMNGTNGVTDPLAMTVQERALLVAHYLMRVTKDGPDFALGKGRLSDYLSERTELRQPSTVVEDKDGKNWKIYPLLGAHTQALEVMCSVRGEWMLGACACQVFSESEIPPDWLAMSDNETQDWVAARTAQLDEMAESDFEAMFSAWTQGRSVLDHFFRQDFNDEGVVFMPWATQEGGAGDVPARFLPRSCLSALSLAIYDRPERVGGPAGAAREYFPPSGEQYPAQ